MQRSYLYAKLSLSPFSMSWIKWLHSNLLLHLHSKKEKQNMLVIRSGLTQGPVQRLPSPPVLYNFKGSIEDVQRLFSQGTELLPAQA